VSSRATDWKVRRNWRKVRRIPEQTRCLVDRPPRCLFSATAGKSPISPGMVLMILSARALRVLAAGISMYGAWDLRPGAQSRRNLRNQLHVLARAPSTAMSSTNTAREPVPVAAMPNGRCRMHGGPSDTAPLKPDLSDKPRAWFWPPALRFCNRVATLFSRGRRQAALPQTPSCRRTRRRSVSAWWPPATPMSCAKPRAWRTTPANANAEVG
jgi:hypothetical protein